MIRLTLPTQALTPPPKPGPRALRPVLPVGDSMAVAESGDMVMVELYGQVFNGNRMVTLLSPEDAKRLAMELGVLARKLRP